MTACNSGKKKCQFLWTHPKISWHNGNPTVRSLCKGHNCQTMEDWGDQQGTQKQVAPRKGQNKSLQPLQPGVGLWEFWLEGGLLLHISSCRGWALQVLCHCHYEISVWTPRPVHLRSVYSQYPQRRVGAVGEAAPAQKVLATAPFHCSHQPHPRLLRGVVFSLMRLSCPALWARSTAQRRYGQAGGSWMGEAPSRAAAQSVSIF